MMKILFEENKELEKSFSEWHKSCYYNIYQFAGS